MSPQKPSPPVKENAAPKKLGSYDRDQLRALASSLRNVNIAILLYFLLIPLNFAFFKFQNAPGRAELWGFVVFAFLLFAAVSIYKLVTTMSGSGIAVPNGS